MDWFERLTGFRETSYDETRRHLKVEGGKLHSRVNGQSYGIGELELMSLQTLQNRVTATDGLPGRLKVKVVTGDARRLHQAPEYAGALFQVASQFNLLEMTSQSVTPEDGVARYAGDPTQGPACAVAAGAATIYRNYFAPVGDQIGQTKDRQLDGLADVGTALSDALKQPVRALWSMQNGYAMCTGSGLDAISSHIASLREDEVDALGARLRIGVHWDVEVTDSAGPDRPKVSQAFCSALPVAYGAVRPKDRWTAFASLVLGAAYEATVWAAVLNTKRGGSNVVLLTRLGGGVFGNDDAWIDAAMMRALEKARAFDLNVKLVSYGAPSAELLQMARAFD